jgi:hypothetical protein
MIIRDLDDPEYQRKVGAHLMRRAQEWGWNPEDGEDAFNYVTRCVYERAIEDLLDGHYLAVSHKTEYLLKKQPKKE